MSTDHLERLGAFIRERREELGISRRELARRANVADVSRLEQGLVVNPRRDTLQALAEALNLTLSELVAVGKQPALPSFTPYMRAKYRDLPDEVIEEVEAFIASLRAKHAIQEPQAGEDER